MLRSRSTVALAAALSLVAAACSSSDDDAVPAPQVKQPAANAQPTAWEVRGSEGRLDKDYAFNVAEKDPTGQARAYSVTGGALPAGLTLSQGGAIAGKPMATGLYKVLLRGQGTCGDATCAAQVLLSIRIADVILLSGFGPFQGMPVNPSWQAAEPLNELMIGGYDVRVIEVPVVWDEALPKYFDEYHRVRPAIALASGVAMGEKTIRLESWARNQAAGADEADKTWKDEPKVDPSGVDKYAPLLPLNMLLGSLKGQGYAVAISSSAGDYLCNFLFYGLMKQLLTENPETHVLGGFVHVPNPSNIPPEKMTEAWKLMIGRLAEYRDNVLETRRVPDDGEVKATLTEPPVY